MLRQLGLVSTSVLAIALHQPARAQAGTTDAQAPTTSGADRAASNEIIVTGTKIATNVQDVPIAITAVTAEALEERQITTFSDLGAVVPNATTSRVEGAAGGTQRRRSKLPSSSADEVKGRPFHARLYAVANAGAAGRLSLW